MRTQTSKEEHAPLFRPLIPWKRPKANIDHIDPKVCEEARKSYSKEGIQREISRYTWLAQNIFVFFGKKEVRFMFWLELWIMRLLLGSNIRLLRSFWWATSPFSRAFSMNREIHVDSFGGGTIYFRGPKNIEVRFPIDDWLGTEPKSIHKSSWTSDRRRRKQKAFHRPHRIHRFVLLLEIYCIIRQTENKITVFDFHRYQSSFFDPYFVAVVFLQNK